MTYIYKEHGIKILEYNSNRNESIIHFLKVLIAKGVISVNEIKKVYETVQDEYTTEIVEDINKSTDSISKRLQ